MSKSLGHIDMSGQLFVQRTVVLALVVCSSVSIGGQGRSNGVSPKASQRATARVPYVPPRTPWGDPDLHGTFTNKYEQSTPFERPPELEGRRVDEVTGAELAG